MTVSEVGKKYSGTSANVSDMAPFALNASETGSGLRHLETEVRGSEAAMLGERQILGLAVDNGCAIVSAGSWHFNEVGGVERVQRLPDQAFRCRKVACVMSTGVSWEKTS